MGRPILFIIATIVGVPFLACRPVRLTPRTLSWAKAPLNSRREVPLRLVYLKGRGVPQSYELAAMWFYRAAIEGQGEAQFQLGMLTTKGRAIRGTTS